MCNLVTTSCVILYRWATIYFVYNHNLILFKIWANFFCNLLLGGYLPLPNKILIPMMFFFHIDNNNSNTKNNTFNTTNYNFNTMMIKWKIIKNNYLITPYDQFWNLCTTCKSVIELCNNISHFLMNFVEPLFSSILFEIEFNNYWDPWWRYQHEY